MPTSTSYADYYEEILKHLRPAGSSSSTTCFGAGAVVDANDQSESALAIRSLNDHVAADERVDAIIVPIADGLTIVRKK